ncbi:MAG: MBL fold metallo-hydrolase [Tissierellia bacterium]|nr:MBL fold metallo-hydrolase [Tissierellia bacterium]
MRKFNKKILLSLLIILLLTLSLSACEHIEINYIEDYIGEEAFIEGQLIVHYIDIGQGDAIFIQERNTDSTYNMLIDAGNNWDGEFLVEYLQNEGVERLDYVIGTHPHADHIGGLDDIIEAFPIGTIIMPRVPANTRTFEEVLEAIANKGLRVTSPKPGMTYSLGEAEFEILAPNSDSYSSLNDYSIVNRLDFGNTSFIFTGDAERASEYEILEVFPEESLRADVLKLGHHGSSSSTTDEFLAVVDPQYAVISCGLDNSYGHPHWEVIEKLEMENIEILRTDEMGSIIITSDGEDLYIEREFEY